MPSKPNTNADFNKLVAEAVRDGWTVRLLDNGKLELTKSREKQEITFDENSYVKNLINTPS